LLGRHRQRGGLLRGRPPLRHGPDGSALQPVRRPFGPRLPRRAGTYGPALLHELGGPAAGPGGGGRRPSEAAARVAKGAWRKRKTCSERRRRSGTRAAFPFPGAAAILRPAPACRSVCASKIVAVDQLAT